MAKPRKYRDEYLEHRKQHPKDGVGYTAFKWRCRNWGPDLAVHYGDLTHQKLKTALKQADVDVKQNRNIYQLRKQISIMQQEAQEEKKIKSLTTLIIIVIFIMIMILIVCL